MIGDVTVVGITGEKRSGKNEVAMRLVDRYGFVKVEMPDPLNEELCILDPWCYIPGWHDSPALTSRVTHGYPYARFSELVEHFGIDMAKDLSPDVRVYQQRYGTDIVRDRIDVDRWVNLARDTITQLGKAGQTRAVIPNIRAANEQGLCDHIIRVVRPGWDSEQHDHPIEQGIKLIREDYVVTNDKTLDALRDAVDETVSTMGLA